MLLFLEVLNETKIGLLEQLFLKKLMQVILPLLARASFARDYHKENHKKDYNQ